MPAEPSTQQSANQDLKNTPIAKKLWGFSKDGLGTKRRFGMAGIINVILTNLALQALLFSNVVSVTVATLISQVINTCIGYVIYGKLVFRTQGLRHRKPIFKYLILMTAIWLLNIFGIELGELLGLSKNLAAIAMIPCLAATSYFSQKHWAFK